MQKYSTVDQIKIEPNGVISIRIAKQVIDDDGSVLANGWHMMTLEPGADTSATLTAVSANLAAEYGYPAISEGDAGRVEAVALAVWTPEVVSAYQAAVAAPPSEAA